jgi:hypothetical protein
MRNVQTDFELVSNTNIDVFKKIDLVIDRIISIAKQPEFNDEIELRNRRSVPATITNQQLMGILVELIAYSQAANSATVEKDLIQPKILDKVFADYDIEKIALMKPVDIVETYWDAIKAIRFKKKISAICLIARNLQKVGSFYELIQNANIPQHIKTSADIDQFWIGFIELKKIMVEKKVPFLRSTTTLLHFLLHVGYDCVKPDSGVMKAAVEFGIVEKISGEKNLMHVVRTIQEYSIYSGKRPVEIDFYFLIQGGQAWASKHVQS